ncbi:MAG: dirigent protein [Acidobacteria bacterium]|nr:dirigent protein [Acidobacteriota bacterium]
MKIPELMNVQKVMVMFILAALTFLATRVNTLMVGASQDGVRQGRGRMVTRPSDALPTRPSDARQVTTDQEALTALAQIQGAEGKVPDFFNTKIVKFDVAENGKKFTPDETPLFPDGVPAYGNEFTTEGYIYPYGTLNGTNGVKEDGSPEFPDKVIGLWFCRGWHVGQGGKTEKGPWVATNQIYDFGHEAGSVTITTDGFETPEHVPIHRAITGGTGPFSLARGEAVQTFLGFNQSAGVSLRYDLRVLVK